MAVFHHKRPIITDGLEFSVDGYNSMSSTSGSTTVYDMVDHVSGVASSSSIADGEVLVFDGVSDEVVFGDTFDTDGSSPFTMSVRFKTTMTGTGEIFSKTGGGAVGYQFRIGSGNVQFVLSSNGSDYIFVYSNTSLNDGEWHEAVFTYNGNTLASGFNLYVDGVSESLTTGRDAFDTSSSTSATLNLGYSESNIFIYTGQISTVKLYRKEFTAAEMKYNYDATKYRYI